MMTVNGASPVMAIVEDLTTTMCRLRSMSSFDVGDTAAFEFTLRGAPKLPLAGRIASISVNGPRRTYTIAFDARDHHQTDRIAVVLDMARRFAESHHHDVQVAAPAGLIRSSVRIVHETDVRYRSGDAAARSARMTNISSGGILMNSSDDIPVGTSVELRFSLPNAVDPIVVHARVVAHQTLSPNYNMAFFQINEATRQTIEAFVASRVGGNVSA